VAVADLVCVFHKTWKDLDMMIRKRRDERTTSTKRDAPIFGRLCRVALLLIGSLIAFAPSAEAQSALTLSMNVQ